MGGSLGVLEGLSSLMGVARVLSVVVSVVISVGMGLIGYVTVGV